MDTIFIQKIAEILNTSLKDSILKSVRVLNPHGLILHLRKENQDLELLLSANPSAPRAYLLSSEKFPPAAAHHFISKLEKFLKGSQIQEVKTIPLERLLFFKFIKKQGLQEVESYQIIAELMGRRSNIIFTDENGYILDLIRPFAKTSSLKTSSISKSIFSKYEKQNNTKSPNADFNSNPRVRLQIGNKYAPPPPLQKISPFDIDQAAFLEKFQDFEAKNIVDLMISKIAGLSPLTAKIITLKAELLTKESGGLSTNKSTSSEALWDAFHNWLLPGLKNYDGTVSIIQFKDDPNLYATWLPVSENLPNIVKLEVFKNLSEGLETYYQHHLGEKRKNSLYKCLQDVILTALQKKFKAREEIAADLETAQKANRFKEFGELLLGNMHLLKKGLTEIQVIDYYHPEIKPVLIPLKPELNPKDNVDGYFQRHRKALRTVELAGNRLVLLDKDISFLKKINAELDKAEDIAKLSQLAEELAERNFSSKPLELLQAFSTQKKSISPAQKQAKVFAKEFKDVLRFQTSSGYTVLVGKNSRGNDFLTFQLARPSDVWLHVQGYHGSHVVIRNERKLESLPTEVLLEAASLAAHYSQARDKAEVPVDYTFTKFVRKSKGAKLGLVLITRQKTLFVKPQLL